jgi:hypothetical protein
MTLLWELGFPALAVGFVIGFIVQWKRGVKAGIFQKTKSPKGRNCGPNCRCDK